MKKTAFLFPGQGSQHAGMGKEIFDQSAAARRTFEEIDETLGFALSSLCFEGPEEELKLTANTQPAILAVSAALLAAIRERIDITPDLVAGHSLGEYSAVVCAGGLRPTEAASIVRQRGTFMQEAVPAGEGAMAAILGPSLEEVAEICREAAQGDVVSPANINAPGQIVIAGATAAVERAIALAKEKGIRKALLLPVSAPFHCALMKPAEEKLRPVLEKARISDLSIPLVNNVNASIVDTENAVREGLIRQVSSPVRWVESVETMIDAGIRRVVEIGPGSVLTGLVKRISKEIELVNISDAASLDAFVRSEES